MGKSNEMSDKVKRYKEMWKRKLITEAQLDKLVSLGVITKAEKALIIAEEN